MRYVAVAAALYIATACFAADEPSKATRVIEGTKTTFPEKTIPEGVRAFVGAIESCHHMSDGTIKYTADDLKNAQKSDHVRFVFPTPLKVKVLNKKLEVSEAVFAEGVFWLLCGKEVVRSTKYEFDKMKPLLDWYRQTLAAD